MGLSHQALYIAASGAYSNQRKVEVIANNLANVNTFGYKRDFPVFFSYLNPLSPIIPLKKEIWEKLHLEQKSQRYTLLDETWTDFSQGNLIKTGNPLDLAINSPEYFFAVKTPDGIRFTKSGNFTISKDGFLITKEGYKVLLMDGEEVRFPSEPEDITITSRGDIFVGIRYGEERKSEFVGRIGVFHLPPGVLEKVGENLFKVKTSDGSEVGLSGLDFVDGGDDVLGRSYEVLQGYLEGSNVNPINEMVELISAQRVFDSTSRVIVAVDGTLVSSARELGRI